MNLDKKVLARIEKERIRIRPRWFFVLKNALDWAWALTLEIGSIVAFGVAIMLLAKENNLYGGLFLVGLFVLLFFWGFRRFFEAGFSQFYKLGFVTVFLVLFVLNGTLGLAFWESGSAEKLEDRVEKSAVYQKIEPALEKAFGIRDERNEKSRECNFKSGRQEKGKKRDDDQKAETVDDSQNKRDDDSEDKKKNEPSEIEKKELERVLEKLDQEDEAGDDELIEAENKNSESEVRGAESRREDSFESSEEEEKSKKEEAEEKEDEEEIEVDEADFEEGEGEAEND